MGDNLPPLELLTEEEAALLAEYGVKGPYDDLLRFPAASTCVFDYGGRDVFLTGTRPDEGDDDNKRLDKTDAGEINHVDHTWPLDCVLLHHTHMLSYSTAIPLWDGVNGVLNGDTKIVPIMTPHSPLSVERSDAVGSIDREEGKFEMEDVSPARQFNRYERSDLDLLVTADDLLREADELLAKRIQYLDPMAEDYLLERERAALEEERRWSPIHGAETTTTALTESDGSSEDEDAAKEKNGKKELKNLFAYEFGPTTEEQQTLHEWDEAVLRCEQRLELLRNNAVDGETMNASRDEELDVMAVVFPSLRAEEYHGAPILATHSPSVKQHTGILESIATMEARDSELQAAACQQLEKAREERRRPRRAPPAEIVFDQFLTRVNQLLPPNEMEVKLEATETLESAEEVKMAPSVSGEKTAVGDAKSHTQPLSTNQVQRNARREGFRVRCELREAWCMQEEDRRATRLLLWRKEEATRIQNDIQGCLSDERSMREILLLEECNVYREISYLERQSAFKAKENEKLRQEEFRSQLVRIITKEHADIRHEIMAMEEGTMREILREEQNARDLLLVRQQEHTAHSITAVSRSNFTEWEDSDGNEERITEAVPLKKTAQAWKLLKSSGQFPATRTCIDHSPIGNALRLQSLQREEGMRRKWVHECKKGIIQTASALAELTHGVDERTTNTPLPGVRPGVNSTPTPPTLSNDVSYSSLDNTAIRLDANLAKQLQPTVFGGVKSSLREVAQLCHRLSFALEQVAAVDFASLATLEVCTNGGVMNCKEKHMTPAAPLVQELDLGGNALRTLPLDDLLRVFPSIRRLNISDNGLRDVTCHSASLRGVSEAHAHSLAQSTHLSHLDVSMNKLHSVEVIGKLLPYRLRSLVMYANHVDSLLPLASCTHLESLEASRNRISSLSELQHLSLLRTLDLSENCLITWDAFAQHVLLQNLYLSRNQISAFPKTLFLGFIRQLFMNENQLEVLPSECFCWLPFLSVLHVENNKLRDVSGLAHCPRLTVVGLAFNRLQRVEDLSPLAACKKLRSLSVNENPFTRGIDCNKFGTSAKVKMTLLAWLPQLSELNNEKLIDAERSSAMENEIMWLRPFSMARRLRQQFHESAVYDAWYWPCGSTVEDLQQVCGSREWGLQYMNIKSGYAALFSALTSDVALTTLQKEQDVLIAFCRRRHHDALRVEEELQKRFRESKQRFNPVIHLLSNTVDERNGSETNSILRQHLTALQTMPQIMANMHLRSVLYHERMKEHREARAKVFICEWMRLRLLGRRAKKELESLKAAYAESQRRRYEAAARVIQPVWRGAAFRSRLQRILHINDDKDDDEFTHVSLDFIDDLQTKGDGDGVEAVLQRVLQSHVALPNFPVSSSPTRITGTQDSLVGPLLPRASSVLPDGTSRIGEEERQRPETQPQRGTRRLSQEGRKQQKEEQLPPHSSFSSSSRVDDEWGALVSSQLRKRQKKMERAQRENMRREFMKDPLKVKRALGGG
ncbi:hypothetical protein C3747_28g122 [Trypanosoma cruzi]|uniref:Leucine-rich repeat protein (LRRP) n=2 Tax=Trypanosoma cruzi TaxID=5693 RepID=Q4DT75_TRYCC|nr:hypothetical protein, conserved [Trypanosoma cruzi]EAN95724.1 hypothetical protein, conserved [Trypanosoma cruzi]PWV15675.1 hypothetical protein C3747_28g122 [Trypanosoma cruzi]|eukprot:XP_817575.1 hypothetical protein [Trypanosoma cruzi strain CL Brener]